MAAYTKVIVIGNLGRDIETNYTENGILRVNFSVASTSRVKQDHTNWFRVTAWRKLAETCVTLAERGALRKGSQVYVFGDIDLIEYKGQTGMKYSMDVNADDVVILGSKAEREAAEGNRPVSAGSGFVAPFDPFGVTSGNKDPWQ